MYKNNPQSIHIFKKGDTVTRVSSAYIETSEGNYSDTSFMGQKLIFLGIANGCIYLERSTIIEKVLNGQTFHIPLEIYEKGWNYFEEPDFLKGKGDMLSMVEKAMTEQTTKALEKLHQKAKEEENYELAAKIQKKLKRIKNGDTEIEDLENPDFLFGNFNSNNPSGDDNLNLGNFLGRDDFGLDDD